MSQDDDRTASLMTPAKLAQLKPKAAVTPAAWLDQLASDAGVLHVRRLAELRGQLETQAGSRNPAKAAAALDGMGEALQEMDFGLLQSSRGWLARATGKARTAGAEFGQQYERCTQAGATLKEEVKALQARQQAQASATERTLVEFEVEWRALEKILDQGARWLQDMRNQLKTRQPADEAGRRQLHEDAARCELLLVRLKALRAVSTAAQQAHEQARASTTRGTAVLQSLQELAGPQYKAWETAVAPLAAGAANPPQRELERGTEAHKELRKAAEHAAGSCAQLREQEQALGASLSALGEQLRAAS